MPGGKLRFGESFEEGARREVLEETGIVAGALRVIALNNDAIETAHFVTVGLLCEEFDGDPRVMEPDEITEWRWFPLDSLPSPLYFPSEKVLKNFSAGAFYIPQG
jgi:8-oxo-dGTP diphosphatase